jgi:glycosyltransferase involved in cell wall biosynthesis
VKLFESKDDEIIVFISFEKTANSRTKTYFDGLIELGYKCRWYEIRSKSIFRDIFRIVKNLNIRRCSFVVASPSHLLVPYVFLVTKKMPFFDLGWPLVDGVITSRKNYGVLKINLIKTVFIDFVSIIFSKIVFVESHHQLNRLNKVFFFCKEKFVLLPTGFNESRFGNKIAGLYDPLRRVVLFRGGDLPEAGIDVLISAIRMNTNKTIRFVIISRSIRLKDLNLPDTEVFTDYLTDEEIGKLYASASVVLGQLSSHKRTNWTIPHKFYEAAYLGKPYITSNSAPMIEFENISSVKLFNGGDALDLIKTIDRLVNNSNEMEILSSNIYQLYNKNFNQQLLSKFFLSYINKYK